MKRGMRPGKENVQATNYQETLQSLVVNVGFAEAFEPKMGKSYQCDYTRPIGKGSYSYVPLQFNFWASRELAIPI